jgi:hypothetical protein
MDEQFLDERTSYPSGSWDEQFESDMKKSIKVLLEDKFVEDKLEGFPLWAMTTKTSKLTFLKAWEVPILESHLESQICSYLMSLPPCRINDDVTQNLDQVRTTAWFNIRRSAGTENNNMLNERTALVTQVSQSISSGGIGGVGGGAKKSFFKRLFGG